MNAITLYYLAQYLVVFVISYFRIRKAFQIQDPTTPNSPKFNWKPVLFVSLEVVYTSAGLIIVLIDGSKEWAPVIIIFYIILILISSNLTSIEERFSENSKLASHCIITAIIIGGTIFVLNKDRQKRFQVSIPYYDSSLKKSNKVNRNFYYEINTNSERTALDSAITRFWKDETTNPINIIDSIAKDQILEIIDKQIIVKEINDGIRIKMD